MKKTIKITGKKVLYNVLTNRCIFASKIVIDTENKVVDVYSTTIPKTSTRYDISELEVYSIDTDITVSLEEYESIYDSTLTTEQKEIIERLLAIGNSIQTTATKALNPEATKMDIIVALAFARDLKIEAYGTTSEKTKEA